jgi:hypothetical protein
MYNMILGTRFKFQFILYLHYKHLFWHNGSGGTCLAMGAMLLLSFDALLA